jgi:hypothetical protein
MQDHGISACVPIYLFGDRDGMNLPIRWRNKPVVWRLCLALEDFEHQRDAFEA